MYKAYKFRLYPTKEQSKFLDLQINSCRFIYNYCLDLQIKEYQINKKKINKYQLQREITILKQNKDYLWLRKINAQSLNRETEHLERGFISFFKKQSKFPKFKSKKDKKQSFTIPLRVRIENSKLIIPKLKEGIKIVQHRDLPSNKFTSCTISKTPTNKYFASINIEISGIIPVQYPICENQAVGLDLGIKTFATLSDGNIIENPRCLKKNLRKLKRLQKQHSKKKMDSNNKEKARLKLAILYEKISNQRRDFLEKVTTQLVTKYDTICLETLSSKNMIKNHKLAQALSDVAFGTFNQLIERKAKEQGKNIIRIGQFEPSSKLCTCGIKNNELKLSDRIWTCKSCGETHDRDLLAANNIKRFAFVKSQ